MTDRNHTSHAKTPVDYDLTCWYLNRRRVFELLGIKAVVAAGGTSDQMARTAELVALKNALAAWLSDTKPPTLGQLIIKGELCEHVLFTHLSNFFGRGLTG